MLASRRLKTTNAKKVCLASSPPYHPILAQAVRLQTDAVLTFLTGKPVAHQFAKELLVGFAAAEVDKLAETKGEDWFDKERAKHEAKKHAENMYDEHYVRHHNADEYDPERYEPHEHYERHRREENRW